MALSVAKLSARECTAAPPILESAKATSTACCDSEVRAPRSTSEESSAMLASSSAADWHMRR